MHLYTVIVKGLGLGRPAGVLIIALWRATRRTSTLIPAGEAYHLIWSRIPPKPSHLGERLVLHLVRGIQTCLMASRSSIPCIACHTAHDITVSATAPLCWHKRIKVRPIPAAQAEHDTLLALLHNINPG